MTTAGQKREELLRRARQGEELSEPELNSLNNYTQRVEAAAARAYQGENWLALSRAKENGLEIALKRAKWIKGFFILRDAINSRGKEIE